MSGIEASALSFEPLYYADRLRVINPLGDVGLVTLWSPIPSSERVLTRISGDILNPGRSRIAVLSNLYGDGLHQMLCNLLYNPQIRHLVAVGEDLGLPTVSEIEALLKGGVEETMILGTRVCRIMGTDRVFPLLEGFDVERLRRTLSFRYLGRLSDDDVARELPAYLVALPRHPAARAEDRLRVEIPPPMPDDYVYRPSDITSHQISRSRPLDCWEELVTRTIRFGHPVELRSGPRLELLNTRVVITDPSDDLKSALEEYGFSLDRFHAYQRNMMVTEKPDDIDYTYGNRLGGHFQRAGKVIDSLAYAVRILMENPESRNAYISLWDTAEDLAGGEVGAATPCLVTLFFRRCDGCLTLTATYRSHNLLTAWLQNVYGLMGIQQEICRQIEVPPGPITVISHSLGIDPRSPRYGLARRIAKRWDRDEDLNRTTGKHSLREDPNGYFVVTIDEEAGQIVAEHRFGALLVKQYRADRAAKIEREVIGDMAVSLVSHALWLGRELMTKEETLRLKLGRRRPGPGRDQAS